MLCYYSIISFSKADVQLLNVCIGTHPSVSSCIVYIKILTEFVKCDLYLSLERSRFSKIILKLKKEDKYQVKYA